VKWVRRCLSRSLANRTTIADLEAQIKLAHRRPWLQLLNPSRARRRPKPRLPGSRQKASWVVTGHRSGAHFSVPLFGPACACSRVIPSRRPSLQARLNRLRSPLRPAVAPSQIRRRRRPRRFPPCCIRKFPTYRAALASRFAAISSRGACHRRSLGRVVGETLENPRCRAGISPPGNRGLEKVEVRPRLRSAHSGVAIALSSSSSRWHHRTRPPSHGPSARIFRRGS